jgi:hypothetical protein
VLSVERFLELGWWDVAAVLVQTAVVVPVLGCAGDRMSDDTVTVFRISVQTITTVARPPRTAVQRSAGARIDPSGATGYGALVSTYGGSALIGWL